MGRAGSSPAPGTNMFYKSLLLVIFLLPFTGCNSSKTTGTPTSTSAPTGDKSSPTPTLDTNFVTNNLDWVLQLKDQDKKLPLQTDGSITFGVADVKATDQSVVKIVLPGIPALGPNDASSPSYANQISTKQLLSFGTYRTRVKAASCQPNEEVVTGVFTYSYGADLNGDGVIDAQEESADTNKNGINDNNEIDIEILCGTPNYLWMTIWTDYTDDTHLQKVTRRIDLATSKIKQTTPGQEETYGTNSVINETIPGLPIPGFDFTSNFYEMGFDWQPDHVRYFIVVNGQEITLWNFAQKNFIPQNSAHFMLNVWHDNEHWVGSGDPADYPNQDATLEADWFQYWTN